MIIFHEGLPRSGKSYEAMKERIVPAIKKGREVVAYVEGINHAKVAELAGVPEDRCRELLHVLTRADMENWLAFTRDNALHVFDEAQNFWGNRVKLSEAQTQFVTEHGHRGIDVVLMGQDLRDVHATWRRRVELKLCFLKLNGLGMAGRYSVTTFRHLGGDQFSRAGFSMRKYDPRYFGSYASHVSDDINAEVYTDSRGQLWSHWGFRYALPVLVVAVLWGAYTVKSFFSPATKPAPVAAVAKPPAQQGQGAPVQVGASAAPVSAVAAPSVQVDQRSPVERRLVDLGTQYRIRLAGLLVSGDRFEGVVEWVDPGSRVMERLTIKSLRDMGVAVVRSDGFVRLAVGGWSELATMWPTEAEGRVSAARLEATKGSETNHPGTPVQTASVGGLGSLGAR